MSTHEQARVRERVLLFAEDEFHPLLNNHALHGKYENYRSINVGGDVRAIFKEIGQNTARFVEIGTHGRLHS